MENNKKMKVVAYLRLSKEEYSNEKESNSITNQRQIIANYLKEHREYKLVDYYIDDGYSGTNFDRPEFQRMLEDIKNKNKDVSVMKKWNPEMVNTILKNENYTGTLLQGKRRKLNYRVNKQIQLEKENWIITSNHHEAIISKEKFDKVQDILNRQAKVNKDGSIGILSGFLKCKCCGGNMIKRTSKERIYYYCSNYYRNKTCENNESISENKLIEIINEKLNLSNITRLELENKVKCIYIDKKKNVKIDIK